LDDYYWRNQPINVPTSVEKRPDGLIVTSMSEEMVVPPSVNLMFSRIMEYYAYQIGLPLGIYGGAHAIDEGFYAATIEKKIYLGIRYEDATKVSLPGDILSNSNNLKNTLVHEHQHYKDQHFGNSSGRNVVLRHLDIYHYQIKDKTWLNTTKNFRNAMYNNISHYLHQLTKENDIITEIKRFNETLGRNVFVYDSKTKAIKTNYE
jgi:hypothetical protein